MLDLDVIALHIFTTVDQLLKTGPKYEFGVYSRGSGGFKVAGNMVPTDGAPQLRFAYMSQPYADTTGFAKDWRGFTYYPQSTIDHCTKLAYEKNIQYFRYSDGDAGIDMTLSALARAIKETAVTEGPVSFHFPLALRARGPARAIQEHEHHGHTTHGCMATFILRSWDQRVRPT